MRFKPLWQTRILIPLLTILKQGVSPDKIALSIAFGLTLGVFPVLGSTTLLCAFAAYVFRLNQPAIHVMTFVVYPLQMILLIPFYHAGAFLFSAPMAPLTVTKVMSMLNEDLWNAVSFLWHLTLRAMVAWCLIGPPVTLLLYLALRPVIRRLPFRFPATSEDELG